MEASVFCASCGVENDSTSRFCRSCGTPLTAAAPGPDTRKIVTILFCDITDSTPLAEGLDAETLRHVLSGYFTEMNGIVGRHGGRTEKYLGDAIMAVFGIPLLHEDDAQRACRAAVEMRARLGELNEELEGEWGVRIATRTGINTGEIIAGDPSRAEAFVLGDVANVAARLEQAASPGEILIGDSTYRVVRDVVDAELVGGLELKGKAKPVVAWRLFETAAAGPRTIHGLDSPLIGRDRELAQLRDAFRRAVESRSCELVTIVGDAGTGKSRLSREFLSDAEREARVLTGQCVSYGEGITFWPIAEVIRDAAGIDDVDAPDEARAKIAALVEADPDSALVAERLGAILGLSDVTPRIEETFFAVRRALEQVALRQPLVVVLDDIHWGESTFLDLIEYLADRIGDVPVLLLCMSRPDLLDPDLGRADWMTANPNASSVILHPLDPGETACLIESLVTGAQLGEELRAQIVDVAEGNPLFVEETLRMFVDEGLLQVEDGQWSAQAELTSLTIPPTIHALLTARLDRLDADNRAVVERAAIIGRTFWWTAVSDLSDEERRADVERCLHSLTRKELIRPEPSDGRDDTFEFTHVLIRDAAYGGIPKTVRVELHEQLAEWLEQAARDRAADVEIVGFHLEQAWRTLSEIAPRSERIHELGRRAAGRLAVAGRRAFARGDMPAAVNLLTRALELGPGAGSDRRELLPELAQALLETGDLARLQEVVGELRKEADASGDLVLQAHALILGLWMQLFADPEGWAEQARREATRAIAIFEEQRDETGLARSWALLGLFHLLQCQFAASEDAWREAAAHAHAAGNQREELEALAWVPIMAWGGPTPVPEAIRRCEEVLERANGDRKAMATALFMQACLEAMQGRFEVARDLAARARTLLEEVALTVWAAGPLTQMTGWVELLAGDPEAAERHLRPGVELLHEIGELAWLSTAAGILAEALYASGRYDEAEEFAALCEESGASDDAFSQALLRAVRAKLLARHEPGDEAVQLAREATEIAGTTDFLFLQTFALAGLAEVLQSAGRVEESDEVLGETIRIAERKGFTVAAENARGLLSMSGAR
jgi:class 3 adenylate cyclase/tetratricopeptide (TPR) repeat protein